MKKANYHVCPVCGGVSLTTGTAEITCCGRRLAPLTPRPAEGTERLEVSPVADELLLTIKNEKKQYRLLMSASASLPLLYLTESNKPSPMTAPGFCMLLRKHLNGGKIISITQPSLERVLRFEIEHLNELGDPCRKFLIAELMGKHSNLIVCREDDLILDSIKHVSSMVSSVREVLPGRTYFIPATQEKLDPLKSSPEEMTAIISAKPLPLGKALYTSLTAFPL